MNLLKIKLCLTFNDISQFSKLLFISISTVRIPVEILKWSLPDRKRFVRSMKHGKISVYSGRGMVIGCAEAGKTTLVKKLKGERDLVTVSTRGIEIHSHVFRLSSDETTITDKYTKYLFNEQGSR